MVLRPATLIVLLSLTARSAAWSAPGSADSLPTGLEKQTVLGSDPEWQAMDAAEELDAEALAELDDLILEPVRLNDGDVDRLQAIPWLGTDQLQSLRAALPLQSLDRLERLPGWDAALARRTRPFVTLAPPRHPTSACAAATSLRMDSKHRVWRAHAAGARWTVAARDDPFDRRRPGGYVRIGAKDRRVWFGDLGLGHAQGLLCWTGAQTARLLQPPYRHERGVVGFETPGGVRTITGFGADLRLSVLAVRVVIGEQASGAVHGAFATCDVAPGVALQLGSVRLEGRDSGSFAARAGGAEQRCQVEVATSSSRLAVAAATEVQRREVQIAARIEATPQHDTAPLAALSDADRRHATRVAQLGLRTRRGPVRVETALLQSSRSDSSGDRSGGAEQSLRVEWRLDRAVLVVQFRQRATRSQDLGEESLADAEQQRRRVWGCSIGRDIAPGWAAVVSWGQSERDGAPRDSLIEGMGWQLRLLRHRGAMHASAGFASFQAPRGAAGLALLDPAPAVGLGRTQGDGLRAGAQVRWTGSRYDFELRLAQQWNANRAGQAAAELRIGLHRP